MVRREGQELCAGASTEVCPAGTRAAAARTAPDHAGIALVVCHTLSHSRTAQDTLCKETQAVNRPSSHRQVRGPR